MWLEHRGIGYVAATRCNDDVITIRMGNARVNELSPRCPPRRGAGSPPVLARTAPASTTGPECRSACGGDPAVGTGVLARRSITDPTEIAYYICYA
ncbi:hypothetical protein GCM10009682_15390 [Luedemannella flava]|uniref:Uncharacterized protein n=1 Tax=Luedemannella flava TaxID=349316 RepID=A0ABN2LNB7_9ACTN